MTGKKARADVSGAQIRAARALLDISQSELAAAAGITRVTLTTLETGRRVSYDATMQSVVDALRTRGILFVNDDSGVGVVLGQQMPEPPAEVRTDPLLIP